MTIIGFLDDVNYLIGHDLIKELEANNMNEFIEGLKIICKKYSNLKNKYESDFRSIRNNSAAHKSKDSRQLLSYCNNLGIENLSKITVEISLINNEFEWLTNKIEPL